MVVRSLHHHPLSVAEDDSTKHIPHLSVSHGQEVPDNTRNGPVPGLRPVKTQIHEEPMDMAGSAQRRHIHPELTLQGAEGPGIEEQSFWEIALIAENHRAEKNVLESPVQDFAQARVRQRIGKTRLIRPAHIQTERDPRLGQWLQW